MFLFYFHHAVLFSKNIIFQTGSMAFSAHPYIIQSLAFILNAHLHSYGLNFFF